MKKAAGFSAPFPLRNDASLSAGCEGYWPVSSALSFLPSRSGTPLSALPSAPSPDFRASQKTSRSDPTVKILIRVTQEIDISLNAVSDNRSLFEADKAEGMPNFSSSKE